MFRIKRAESTATSVHHPYRVLCGSLSSGSEEGEREHIREPHSDASQSGERLGSDRFHRFLCSGSHLPLHWSNWDMEQLCARCMHFSGLMHVQSVGRSCRCRQTVQFRTIEGSPCIDHASHVRTTATAPALCICGLSLTLRLCIRIKIAPPKRSSTLFRAQYA